MTKQEQIEYFESFVEKQRAILLAKGDDYAGEDRLSNFKLVAQIVGITPEQVVLVFVATKAVRLGQLFQGKEPKNESKQDSVLDGGNYNALMAMILSEKEN
jgi:hypothetical protein